jgi:hypothetical protein
MSVGDVAQSSQGDPLWSPTSCSGPLPIIPWHIPLFVLQAETTQFNSEASTQPMDREVNSEVTCHRSSPEAKLPQRWTHVGLQLVEQGSYRHCNITKMTLGYSLNVWYIILCTRAQTREKTCHYPWQIKNHRSWECHRWRRIQLVW